MRIEADVVIVGTGVGGLFGALSFTIAMMLYTIKGLRWIL